MNSRLVLVLGALVLVACGRESTPPAGQGNACAVAADCVAPLECRNGLCEYPEGLVCQTGDKRCNGLFVEECTADTAAGKFTWAPAATPCKTACINGACLEEACSPGESKCDGIRDANDPSGQTLLSAVVVRCNDLGTGFEHFESCPAGCNFAQATKTASCVPQACEPFETRCDAGDATHVRIQECDRRGKGFVTRQCETGKICSGGECVAKACTVSRDGSGSITGRQERCSGNVLERCRDDEAGFYAASVCELGCNATSSTTAVCATPGCRTGPNPTDFASAGFTRCKPDDATKRTIQVCNATATAWVDSTCSSPFGQAVCDAAQCVPQVCSVVGSTRQQRCNGRVREECEDTLSSYRPIASTPPAETYCAYGCYMDGSEAKCVSPECAFTFGSTQQPEEQCYAQSGQPSAVRRCGIDGKFDFLEYCANGCTASAGVANCNPLSCEPLARRCQTDSLSGVSRVELCDGNGTGYFPIVTCDQGCADGVCVMSNANCVIGETRCLGANVESCVGLPGGATEWRYTESCVGRCSNGVCDGAGACGCAGGVSAAVGKCGVSSRQPIAIKRLLPANLSVISALVSLPEVPCDGVSRVLFYTEPVTDSEGTVVPDGTIVTFTLDDDHANGARMASGDLDASLAGVQRPTYRGRARVIVKAPSSAACTGGTGTQRTVTLRARVGDRCEGTTTSTFRVQGGSSLRRYVYVAEDFSTNTFADRSTRGTTLSWDAGVGHAYAVPGWDPGTGQDGDVTFDDGAPTAFDLTTAGFARNANVIAFGADSVDLDRPSIGVAPGDEVLVITVKSSSAANLGVHEFKRVASVGRGTVTFTTPIGSVFGVGSNTALSTSRVVLQRVPNFNSVVLPSAEVVTTQNVDAGGSGVIAFRVRGTARLLGAINANGLGTVDTLGNLRRNGRLVVAPGNDVARGGGVVFINATTIEHSSAGTVSPTALVSASGLGSGVSAPGGTIVLGAGYIGVGATARATDPVVYAARGGLLGSGNGQIRLNYGSISQDFSAVNNVLPDPHFAVPNTAPNFVFGNVVEQCPIDPVAACTLLPSRSGSFFAQSVGVHTEPPAPATTGVKSAQLMGLLAGSGAINQFLSTAANGSLSLGSSFGVQGRASTTGPWGDLSGGLVVSFVQNPATPDVPEFGKEFRWRVRASVLGSTPVDLIGIAVRLEINNP